MYPQEDFVRFKDSGVVRQMIILHCFADISRWSPVRGTQSNLDWQAVDVSALASNGLTHGECPENMPRLDKEWPR